MRGQVRPSTANGYEARWRQIKPWLSGLRLRDTSTPDVQQILVSVHKLGTLNHDSIRALRYLLKMIFDHAIRMGLLNTNPVSSSKVPKRSEDEECEDTYAYSLEEVQQMLAVLPEPARTAVATCAFTGVRRGELAGLLWENFDVKKGSMKITQSVWEGHVTRPKTKKSKATVPIIKSLVRMLEAHRLGRAQAKVKAAQKRTTQAKKSLEGATLPPEKRTSVMELVTSADKLVANPPIPDSGPIFASSDGTPINMNNLLNRQILPALNRCQHCQKPKYDHGRADHKYLRDESVPSWHGWHGFRRGLGTNLKRLGVDLKTVQEILRHAHIATTADIYVKEVSEQAVEAMERLKKHVDRELKKAPHSDPAIPYSAPNLHQGSWIATPYSE